MYYFRANHSKAVVYNQCSNLLLRHAIETFGGQKSKPLFSLHTAKPQKLPPMPSPGEVDFIYGGLLVSTNIVILY